MKAKSTIFLLITGIACVTNCNVGHAQTNATDKQAIAMIKEFYTAYITASSNLSAPASLAKLQTLPKKYCTTSLLSRINAQLKRGYVNSDPFIFAQDTDDLMLKTLAVKRDSKKINSYTVSYRYPTTPGSTEMKIIHLTVIKQGGSLKIASIR